MSNFNNRYSGCFDGNGNISLYNNEKVKVKNLKKGDKVLSIFNKVAEVICIIRTKIESSINLVDFNGVKLTPWHPIFIKNKWVFPIDIKLAKEYDFKFENDKDKYIYNVVLDSGHVLIINDVKCVTLGHNYTDNNVIKHPYFGSQEIIKDLKKKYSDEWNNGLITLKKNSYIRNENTKLISNLV